MNTKPFRAFRAASCIVLLVVLFLAIGLLPFARPVQASPLGGSTTQQAQTSGITMKVTPAYGGNFKYGEWLPVWIELENQGDDLDGDVRIDISSSQGSLVFDTPVSLPSGARKRVALYVLPNNFSRELTVNLVSKNKTVVSQKAAVRPQSNIGYIVGLLAPERGALALLNGVRFPGQERPKILVDLNLAEFPERPEGLRSFDLLILNDSDTSKMTPEQAAALAGWVQQGGRLVIGGGAGAQQTLAGLPAEMLPLQLQGVSEVNIEALQPLAIFTGKDLAATSGTFIVARGVARDNPASPKAAEGLRPLVVGNDFPLVQEWNWGTGMVDYIALDLAGVPFDGWPGTQTFWETLIGASGSYPENMPIDMSPRQYRANMLTYPLSNIPSLDLPSVKGLSILLGIYILIIGPVNYLVLRRIRRLHLAWVTIPILTLLFAGGAFGVGYALRGNDLILNRVALVEVRPNGEAGVTSYMGLFSPRMQSYEVTVQGESLISPMTGNDQGGWGRGVPVNGTGGQMVFVQDQPSRVRGLSVNQWAMQSFMAESSWPEFGKITGDLQIENDVLKGTVRNDSGYTISDVIVTLQGRFVRLGDMAPGDEKPVNIGLSSPQSDRFGPPLSYRIFQERFANGPMPRDVEQKTNILSSVFENGPWSKMLSSVQPPSMGINSGTFSSVLVFGWLDQAPPQVDVPNNRLTQKTTALVYTTMEYNLPDSGYLSLPPGMIPGVITSMPPNSGNCGIATSIQMMQGKAEFEYQVPGNLEGFRVQTLKLNLSRDNGNANILPGIALYNWQDKSWTNIQDPIAGTNVIQKAGPYVSENGVIRVQMSTQNDTFGCIYLDLGIEAERISAAVSAGQGG